MLLLIYSRQRMYLKKILLGAGVSIVIYGAVISCSSVRGRSYPYSLISIDKKQKIFLDFRPVSNLDWREYMYYIKEVYGEHSVQFQSTWPDTIVWKTKYPEESFDKSLILHANSPIVGITYSQAVEYCRWRTMVVNQKFKLKLKFELPSRHIYEKVFASKKFIIHSEMPYVRNPPKNTFYNLCGDTPEYTSDSALLLVKANQIGQCLFTDFERTKYTLPGFRCAAIRVSD